jgi:hypothetical protein
MASVISDGIGYERSNDASECTEDDDPSESELFRRYQKSCERHDRFTRYWENHALHSHSDENRNISGLMDESGDICRQKFSNSHNEDS